MELCPIVKFFLLEDERALMWYSVKVGLAHELLLSSLSTHLAGLQLV